MVFINILSLYDGMSNGQIALGRIGIKVDKYYASEIDPYAIKITQKNYPNTIQLGDIEKVDFTKFRGKIGLGIGGSPCTYWSINKKDRETTSEGIGFNLFMQYVRAIKESETPYFLYENNYKIHDDIKNEITKHLGVEPIMINSSLVSAQKRERLYWTNIPNVTQPEDKGLHVEDIIDFDYVSSENLIHETRFKDNYPNSYSDKLIRIGTIGKGGQGERVYSIKGKSVNLTANGGGRGAKTGLYEIGGVVRKLTPLECERLQTVPEDYTEGVSDSQRYKMLGNGWTVDVIAHLLKGLKEEVNPFTFDIINDYLNQEEQENIHNNINDLHKAN